MILNNLVIEKPINWKCSSSIRSTKCFNYITKKLKWHADPGNGIVANDKINEYKKFIDRNNSTFKVTNTFFLKQRK